MAIHIHTIPQDENSIAAILNILKPRLPYCLPLYRRIQFRHFTPTSQILSSIQPNELPSPDAEWIFAFADRGKRPETEIYTFASWETDTTRTSHDSPSCENHTAIRNDLVRALVKTIAGLENNNESNPNKAAADASTTTTTDAPAAAAAAGSRSYYDWHMRSPQICLFGCVHETTASLMQDAGLLAAGFPVEDDGLPESNGKWIFDCKAGVIRAALEREIEGVVWGEVRERDYDLVRSRTSIPRQNGTLRLLPSVAAYWKGEDGRVLDRPIAWAFLGLDGSLTTLHTELEYRGKGIAKALAARLFSHRTSIYTREQGSPTMQEDTWAHADVLSTNDSSKGVCRSLGGRNIYVDYWLRVDLGKA